MHQDGHAPQRHGTPGARESSPENSGKVSLTLASGAAGSIRPTAAPTNVSTFARTYEASSVRAVHIADSSAGESSAPPASPAAPLSLSMTAVAKLMTA